MTLTEMKSAYTEGTATMSKIDMTTPIFNRMQVNTMLEGFRLIGHAPGDFRRDWQIHVGPGTTVDIRFRGPVGADEWDALLAHIAFYKQWYKDMPSTNMLNLEDAVAEVVNRITTPKEPPQGSDNQ